MGNIGAFAKVLNLGCSGVPSLGTALVEDMAKSLRLSARVMNTDPSPAAITAAAEAVGAQQDKQTFRVWDPKSSASVPSLPSPMFACGPSSRYDLLVDIGYLDRVCGHTDSEALVAYLETLRDLLQSVAVDSGVPPLLVHLTSASPAERDGLLAAAFPATHDEPWRVECAPVVEHSVRYLRYTVYLGAPAGAAGAA